MENNVKGLKKQLVAAIAMVLVAAIALGSSTFAWFVNNTSVEARGMHVNAIADGSLVIKGLTASSDQAYSSVGTVGTKDSGNELAKTLSPATSIDGINFAKLGADAKVESADSSVATWSKTDDGTWTGDNLATVDALEMDAYVLEAKYSIASIATDAEVYLSSAKISADYVQKALKMSITFTPPSGSSESAVTKVYDIGGGNPEEVGTLVNDIWSLAKPNYNKMSDDDTWTLKKVDTATEGTATTVTVRVWYEGQDPYCYSNNVDTTGTDITLTFAKKPTQD